MLEAVSYIGFLAVGVFAVTGAYIWMRWGFCGVQAIWRMRERLDNAVQSEVEATVKADAA